MDDIIKMIMESTGTTSPILAWAILIVSILIIIVGIVSIGISIFLWLKYHKLNKTKNSCGLTGEMAARKILDENGLSDIKIKCTGSMLWGNSYSHYFKKLRLRRFTYKKDSVTSLAMAAQKSSLAILDKENDPDMKKRNVLIPLQFFGPLMFIPLVIIGALIDFLIIVNTAIPVGICTLVCAGFGLLLYLSSFVLTIVILKVEIKAQEKSIEILQQTGLANSTEIF